VKTVSDKVVSYLNIGYNRCARLNGPAFLNVFCTVW